MKFMKSRPGRPVKYENGCGKFLIRAPPPCICGNNEYTFTIEKERGVIRARCKKCRYDRYYNPLSNVWGPKR